MAVHAGFLAMYCENTIAQISLHRKKWAEIFRNRVVMHRVIQFSLHMCGLQESAPLFPIHQVLTAVSSGGSGALVFT